MPTCSQCEVNEARYLVGSCHLCPSCLGATTRLHNVRPLRRAPRVNLSRLQAFRRRVLGGEFSGNYYTALPAITLAAICKPRPRRDTFFARMRGSLNHAVRRIASFARKG